VTFCGVANKIFEKITVFASFFFFFEYETYLRSSLHLRPKVKNDFLREFQLLHFVMPEL